MTLLSRIHPYPAMMPDSLVHAIVDEFVFPGARVLDPFCGTGRVLVAAALQGASAVGCDVNPLALLVCRAKMARISVARIQEIVQCVKRCRKGVRPTQSLVQRSVRWFAPSVEMRIWDLVRFLNDADLSSSERVFMAAVLSATVREVSYCRQDQWKIHRISAARRRVHRPDPVAVFCRRLESACEDLVEIPMRKRPTATLMEARAQDLVDVMIDRRVRSKFDVLITSPPYGDSFTTVQYGGLSSLCLEVLSHLDGLGVPPLRAAVIDRACLGGEWRAVEDPAGTLRPYWFGSVLSPSARRVAAFLEDTDAACVQFARIVRRKGVAVFVVARRKVDGVPVYLDKFLVDRLELRGFRLVEKRLRRINCKLTPVRVNKSARSLVEQSFTRSSLVSTMRNEFVVVLEKD